MNMDLISFIYYLFFIIGDGGGGQWLWLFYAPKLNLDVSYVKFFLLVFWLIDLWRNALNRTVEVMHNVFNERTTQDTNICIKIILICSGYVQYKNTPTISTSSLDTRTVWTPYCVRCAHEWVRDFSAAIQFVLIIIQLNCKFAVCTQSAIRSGRRVHGDAVMMWRWYIVCVWTRS